MSDQVEYTTRWSWQSKDSDIITCRLWFNGRVTLDELVEKLREVAPDATDISFGGGMVMWTREPTEQELADRRAWQQQAADAHMAWKRKMHAELNEEFGITRRSAELEKLLPSLVDDDPCWFDHNGACQGHGYILEPGESCPQQRLKELLKTEGTE